MGKPIIKVSPDRDLYVEWSSVVEAPTFVGTRAETLDHLMRGYQPVEHPEMRLQRADETGSSALRDPMSSYAGPLDGVWDDSGWIVEQRGFLPRARLGEFLDRYMGEDPDSAYALLDPLEDDEDSAGEAGA